MELNQCRKVIRLSLVLGGIVFSSQSICNELPLGPLTTQQLEREQQQRLSELESNTDSIQSLVPIPTIPGKEIPEDLQCVEIQELSFSGNSIFSDSELSKVVGFEAGCIGINAINEILRIVSNHYIEAGYVTSRAFMTPQDLSSKMLTITILEGKIDKILFNGEVQESLRFAFPALIGKPLNLRDIEQGLDQINKLARYDAQIKLLPSDKAGYSIVNIQTAKGSLLNVGSGVNNGGQKSTGEEQLTVNLTAENMLGLFDSWLLSATKSAAFSNSKDSESLYLSLDMPFGYWNVGYRTSYSNYKTTFTSQGFKFDSSGRTNSHDLDIRWLFHRDSTSKSSVKASINHRREKNYILDQLLEAGSRNLSSISFAIDHSTRLGNGFMTISPNVSIGTDWFGGEQNLSNDSSVPKAQFIKGTLSGSYSYPIAKSLSITSTIFGQWSNDTLYGSERVSIGGEYSVRGFKGSSISGDEGYYWRNDINYRLGQWPYLGLVSAQLALDTGSIVQDDNDKYEKGSLVGSSAGLRTQTRNVSTSLTLGMPIIAPSFMENDDYVVYYRINITI